MQGCFLASFYLPEDSSSKNKTDFACAGEKGIFGLCCFMISSMMGFQAHKDTGELDFTDITRVNIKLQQ